MLRAQRGSHITTMALWLKNVPYGYMDPLGHIKFRYCQAPEGLRVVPTVLVGSTSSPAFSDTQEGVGERLAGSSTWFGYAARTLSKGSLQPCLRRRRLGFQLVSLHIGVSPK